MKLSKKTKRSKFPRSILFARWFLNRIVRYEDRRAVVGDFEEAFNETRDDRGAAAAWTWYSLQIIKSLPSLVSNSLLWSTIMFKNYLKIAFRNLLKHKSISFINIFGLSLGIASCIYAFLFVLEEYSYDKFHEKSENIFKILTDHEQYGAVGLSPMPLGPQLKSTYPEVSEYVRMQKQSGTIKIDDKPVSLVFLVADKSFFEVFTFPLISGVPEIVLSSKQSAVLTEETAQKYFGDENPVGKQVSVSIGSQTFEFNITGIAENLPSNSTIQFDFLIPFDSGVMQERFRNDLTTNLLETYVLLTETSGDFSKKIAPFLAERWPSDEMSDPPGVLLQPVTNLHHKTDVMFGPASVGNPAYTYILAGVALMILLIACINFITLTAGNSITRAKEVGLRKVLGAHRSQLMKQFWGETAIISIFALAFGILLVLLLLPTLNSLADKELFLNLSSHWSTFIVLFTLMVFIAMTAGSYPALLLSRVNPISALNKKLKIGSINFFGRALVVGQFCLSIVLISGAIAMTKQIDFLKNKDLGYNGSQVVIINSGETTGERLADILTGDMIQYKNILQVSRASFSFGGIGAWGNREIEINNNKIKVLDFKVDHNYIKTLEMEIMDGRDFSEDFPSDESQSLIINEAFANKLGIENPVGSEIQYRGTRTIVGIVKNFHIYSLHNEIEPVALHMSARWPVLYTLVKISPDNTQETLAFLEQRWTELNPGLPFTYSFLDDTMRRMYSDDERWSAIVQGASIFAIVVACMGLFGLTSLGVSQRIKEIGIRKVIGASVAGVVNLFTKDLLKLIIIANILSLPVGYILINKWLQGFAYQIALDPAIFLFAVFINISLAIVSVSILSYKAAKTNPVETLRYE